MNPHNSRVPLLDALKAIACISIVVHHLAAYGPMSEIAYPLFPGLIEAFYEYGRIAVQVFFVVAGFLFAGKHAPQGVLLETHPLQAIKQRYLRLVVPYLAALILAIGGAAVARSVMNHDSIPGAPGLFQLLAHAFLVQDLLDQEALSAGVWYVAIDFQLFMLAMILLWLARRIHDRYPSLGAAGPVLITALTLCSLLIFNRQISWDETAFYFFGSFGLGMLVYWTSHRKDSPLWLLLLSVLVIAALLVEFRSRIAVAGIIMLLLGLAGRFSPSMKNLSLPNSLTALGRISYSVFLVHFPLCLLVNTTFFHFFPAEPVINALGLVLALAVSIYGGALFFKWVESRPLTLTTRALYQSMLSLSFLLARDKSREKA